MSERFELIGEQGDISGHMRLAYVAGPDDPTLFVLTLTPGYVARVMEKMPPGHARRDHEIRLRQRRRSPGYGVSGKGKRAPEHCSGITRRL
jgi:hypothetical protein